MPIDWTKVKVIIDPSEIPPGSKQVHLYDFKDVLRPRGTMLKESLGLSICEKLLNSYESWTDDKHVDNPDEYTLVKILKDNLIEEAEAAFATFLHCIKTGEKPWEVVYKKPEEGLNAHNKSEKDMS